MLLELGLPSFDTLLYNSRIRFGNRLQCSQNSIVAQLRLILLTCVCVLFSGSSLYLCVLCLLYLSLLFCLSHMWSCPEINYQVLIDWFIWFSAMSPKNVFSKVILMSLLFGTSMLSFFRRSTSAFKITTFASGFLYRYHCQCVSILSLWCAAVPQQTSAVIVHATQPPMTSPPVLLTSSQFSMKSQHSNGAAAAAVMQSSASMTFSYTTLCVPMLMMHLFFNRH